MDDRAHVLDLEILLILGEVLELDDVQEIEDGKNQR